MKRIAVGMLLLVAACTPLAGCSHYPVNDRSLSFDPHTGYRFDALDPGSKNSDALFVCLMFSGGLS